jgi:hypothetical protein
VRYAMLICGDMDQWADASPELVSAVMKETYAWFERWSAAGKIASGGAELQHPSTARTVRPGPDGAPVITDGPYLELKEVVGGVIFLEADDLDDAVAVAATWPGLAHGPNSIEVRPVVVHPPADSE